MLSFSLSFIIIGIILIRIIIIISILCIIIIIIICKTDRSLPGAPRDLHSPGAEPEAFFNIIIIIIILFHYWFLLFSFAFLAFVENFIISILIVITICVPFACYIE